MRSKAHIGSHPIHPMIVAFPVGLWITSFIFDLIGAGFHEQAYFTASYYMIIGGCIGAFCAAVPGLIDLFGVIPANSSGRSRGYIHGTLNTLALGDFIYVAVRRGSPAVAADWIAIACSAGGVLLIIVSGWLGGTLVFRNQVGVDRRYANAGKLRQRTVDDFTKPVCNQSELGDGQIMLIRRGNDRIAVARCAEGLFAFEDHCTHKGGPLSDGALVDCTVQCPWHGSQFDIKTGRVVAGPAGSHVRTYPVEVRAGEVYVKKDVAGGEKPKAA